MNQDNMRSALKNLWFAASARPHRIDAAAQTGLGWLIAYIAFVASLASSGETHLLVIPVVGAAIMIALPKRDNTPGHEWIAVVSIGSTLPAAAITFLGGSEIVVAILIGLGLNTLTRALPDRASPSRAALQESCFSSDADALRRLRAKPQGPLFVEMGPPIGSLRGIDIPAWFKDDQGQTHEFVTSHTQPTPPSLSEDESFVAPGLVYRLVQNEGDPPKE